MVSDRLTWSLFSGYSCMTARAPRRCKTNITWIILWKENHILVYSRTPLIRPPSESHWCGRIRWMVAREGFVYTQNALSVTRNVVVWEGWSLVRVVVRQGFYCTTKIHLELTQKQYVCIGFILWRWKPGYKVISHRAIWLVKVST